MKTTPDYIEINPETKEIGTVILLHGLGADGTDFIPLVNELDLPQSLPLRWVFPHAPMRPITINNGYVMRGWFDIYSLSNFKKVDEEGVSSSVKFLKSLIQREIDRGIPTDKIVLAGFSQGAAIALITALRYPKQLAGIMSLSGCLPEPEKILSESSPANFTTPIFAAHGTQDFVLPYSLGLELADYLQRNKYLVEWHSYVMGHSLCQEEIGDLAVWLQKVFHIQT